MAPKLMQVGQQVKIVDDSDQIVATFARDPGGDRVVNAGFVPAIAVRRRWLHELSGATLIETFASGHGWVARGPGTGGSVALNDATTPGPFAAQSVSVVNGTAGNAGAQKQSGWTLDLTGRSILVWLKFTNHTSNTPGIRIYLSTDSGFTNYYLASFDGPPGATSSVLHDPESGWYCVELFQANMTTGGAPNIASITSLRIDVNSSGAEGAGGSNIGVSFGGIASRPAPSAYPNGVVTFSFDDANASDYTLARPTLAKYGLPAVSYVIADAVGVTGPTAAQYRQMQDELGWEIGGHAYTTANHNSRFETIPAADVLNELQSLKEWMLANGFTSEAFASPGGTSPASVWNVAREFFSSHRGAGYVANWLTKVQQQAPPVRPYALIAITWDMPSGATLVNFKAAMDLAKANKAWLIFNMHTVTSAASTGINISTSDLDSLASYAVAQGIAVATISGVQRDVGLAY